MTRHPVRQPTAARPVVHYYPAPDPDAVELVNLADPASAALYRQHVAEVAARRRQDQIQVARWRKRQAAIAARDRRTRRILLTVAVPVTLGMLVALGVAGWLLWHALAGVSVLAVFLLAALGVGAVGGLGHRCVTIVQHWH